jgi:hypothetical protein
VLQGFKYTWKHGYQSIARAEQGFRPTIEPENRAKAQGDTQNARLASCLGSDLRFNQRISQLDTGQPSYSNIKLRPGPGQAIRVGLPMSRLKVKYGNTHCVHEKVATTAPPSSWASPIHRPHQWSPIFVCFFSFFLFVFLFSFLFLFSFVQIQKNEKKIQFKNHLNFKKIEVGNCSNFKIVTFFKMFKFK